MNTTFKQTWQLIKENRMLSTISILGTALAMAMIIALVFVYQINIGNYAPEVNRDRTLYIRSIGYSSGNNGQTNGFLSQELIRKHFYPLKNVEAVTALTSFTSPTLATSLNGQRMIKVSYTGTDDAFWKVFSFHFLSGTSFTHEEFESGIRKVVISERIARYCFDSSVEAIGQTLKVSGVDYSVCGVVADVSSFVSISRADVWFPYTCQNWTPSWADGEMRDIIGIFNCLILAKSTADFGNIISQVDQVMVKVNSELHNGKAVLHDPPITHAAQLTKKGSAGSSDLKGSIIKYATTLFVLLFVPAINLSGLTISRMRRRIAEIGIRKTFGATHGNIFGQVLYENFLLTLIGSIVGIVLGYLFLNFGANAFLMDKVDLLVGRSSLVDLTTSSNLNHLFHAVFNFSTLGAIFLFCLLLNLMSASIPAWIAARNSIINALNEQK